MLEKSSYKAAKYRYKAAKSRYKAAEMSYKAQKKRYKAGVNGNKQDKSRYKAAENCNKKPIIVQQHRFPLQQDSHLDLQRRSKTLQAELWLRQLGRISLLDIHFPFRTNKWTILST